jgi:simple sugar transport system substrate-binding protein
MTVKHRRRALAGLLLAAVMAGSGSAAAEPLKVGFVYVSPVTDAGWTAQHDRGRRALEAALGHKVETSFVASVAEGPDAERVIRELAASGGYMNPTIRVAERFPDVAFEHASGYKRADNVSTYLARFYEGRYLTGIVAGKMTKTKEIGYIAAFPIPEVVRGINAFTLGLRSVDPEARVRVVWVNSWYDPGREREAAITLIAQGVDVINQTATTHHWGDYYIKRAQAVLDGTWRSQDLWGGIAQGMIKLAPFGPAVPDDVVRLVESKAARIAAGTLHPFQGPIKDQSGKVRVPAGTTMTNGELLAFDWYVEGVTGELPK